MNLQLLARLRRRGITAVLVLAVIVVGFVLAAEAAYRIALSRAGELPRRPSPGLNMELQTVAWATIETRGPVQMVSVWPWRFASIFPNARELPPGWRLASIDARHIVNGNAQARPRSEAEWNLATAAVAIWISRHWTAGEAATYFWENAAFPRGIHGLASASSFFIGRPADTLSLSQESLLAALTIEPRKADPYCNTWTATELQHRVVATLVRASLISSQDAAQALSTSIDAILVPRSDCVTSVDHRP
jgi:Transglycosylase